MGRSNFHTTQPNKNIPMLADTSRTAPWNTFALNQSKLKGSSSGDQGNKGQKHNTKWSVSPLTKIERASIEAKMDIAPVDARHTPVSATTLRNSMESTENRFEDLNRLDASLKSFSSHLKKSNTRRSLESLSQESISSTEEEVMHHDMEDAHDRLSMSDEETSIDVDAPFSVLDFMKDIVHPPSKPSYSNDQTHSHYYSSTRIQQKTMALKNLMQEEEADSNAPLFANLLDYATKIQNEAILAEWGQIRQRFSSFVSSASQKTIACRAGVLGSIIRCRENDYYPEENFYHVGEDEKELYIHRLWFGEPTEVPETAPEQIEIAPVNSPGNFSLMAKNVMLSRQPIEFER